MNKSMLLTGAAALLLGLTVWTVRSGPGARDTREQRDPQPRAALATDAGPHGTGVEPGFEMTGSLAVRTERRRIARLTETLAKLDARQARLSSRPGTDAGRKTLATHRDRLREDLNAATQRLRLTQGDGARPPTAD